jgi:hypothetical protein
MGMHMHTLLSTIDACRAGQGAHITVPLHLHACAASVRLCFTKSISLLDRYLRSPPDLDRTSDVYMTGTLPNALLYALTITVVRLLLHLSGCSDVYVDVVKHGLHRGRLHGANLIRPGIP